MKPVIAACVLMLGSLGALPAHAAGRLAEVSVIDRDTGAQLEAYYHRGEYWVAGTPGAHYAIFIRSHLGERLLAVTSVDGVNVITGQNAGWDQGGYVLDPGESYQITGWRKSDYQIAAFAFTAAAASYAARTGRADNVGVIGVALFREQPADAMLAPQPPQIASGSPEAAKSAPPLAQRAQRETPSAASAPSGLEASSADLSANETSNSALPRSPALGTTHGEREYSYVAHTTFIRRQWQPDEIIRIRYDSLDNLIAMGIVRPHRYALARPTPFPSTEPQHYVPDPPPF